MSLEMILLGMLRKPASGYDLKAEFESSARHFWSAELSQIYPTLQKMETRGWLKSHREPSPRGPERRVYRRTRSGTARYRAWLREPPGVGSERFAYIGQVIGLGELNDLRATRTFFEALGVRLQTYLGHLEQGEAGLRAIHPKLPEGLDEHEFHGYLSLRIGIRSLREKVAVCRENLTLIDARIAKENTP
jgi:PadR family transcriptional regulator, regulatory protein AphA